jgi:hypothetical protein
MRTKKREEHKYSAVFLYLLCVMVGTSGLPLPYARNSGTHPTVGRYYVNFTRIHTNKNGSEFWLEYTFLRIVFLGK